jgi:hypothetical protein
MQELKICRNCKHYRTPQLIPICVRKSETDLVSGVESGPFCRMERTSNSENDCGTSGRFYEPAPSAQTQ